MNKEIFHKIVAPIAALVVAGEVILIGKDLQARLNNDIRPEIRLEETVTKTLPELRIPSNEYSEILEEPVITKEFIRLSIEVESEGYRYAISKKGARGPMQIMPRTWREFGEGSFDNAFDPEKNIEAGTKYYKWIEKYCEKKHPEWDYLPVTKKRMLLLAAYNAGPSELRRRGWDIQEMSYETRNHIRKFKELSEG